MWDYISELISVDVDSFPGQSKANILFSEMLHDLTAHANSDRCICTSVSHLWTREENNAFLTNSSVKQALLNIQNWPIITLL